jgi:hypothetical protein
VVLAGQVCPMHAARASSRPGSRIGAAKLVVLCHVVLLDHGVDGPRVATRWVRGHYRIRVIRHTGQRTSDGIAAAPLTARVRAWSRPACVSTRPQHLGKLQAREAKGSPRAVGVQVNSSDAADDDLPCARRPRAPGPQAPDGRSADIVTGPGSRGQAVNHLGQVTIAHRPGRKTVKAISASIADAESK